jgi:hypothetical protein
MSTVASVIMISIEYKIAHSTPTAQLANPIVVTLHVMHSIIMAYLRVNIQC